MRPCFWLLSSGQDFIFVSVCTFPCWALPLAELLLEAFSQNGSAVSAWSLGRKLLPLPLCLKRKVRLFFRLNLFYALKQKCCLDQEFVLGQSWVIATLTFPGLCEKQVSAGTWSAEVFRATLLPDVLIQGSGRWCWWYPWGAWPTAFSKWLVEGSNGPEVEQFLQGPSALLQNKDGLRMKLRPGVTP